MRVLIALLSALPGAAAVALVVLLFPGQYYQPALFSSGAAMTLISAGAGFLLAGRPWFGRTRFRAALAVMAGFAAGWFAALAVVFVLNLTPLCVGADNGDGNNSLEMCVVYTFLWAIFYTPPLGVMAALGASLASTLYRPPAFREVI